jgi:hypothetical protein
MVNTRKLNDPRQRQSLFVFRLIIQQSKDYAVALLTQSSAQIPGYLLTLIGIRLRRWICSIRRRVYLFNRIACRITKGLDKRCWSHLPRAFKLLIYRRTGALHLPPGNHQGNATVLRAPSRMFVARHRLKLTVTDS